jgi:hypothetical protein
MTSPMPFEIVVPEVVLASIDSDGYITACPRP